MSPAFPSGGVASIDRRTSRTIVLAGAVMLAAYLGAALVFPKPGGRVVFGDATHHFVQLRSIVFDRDVDFLNEHVRIYGLAGTKEDTDRILADLGTPNGRVRNYMPVGPAILWTPIYLLVVGIQWLLSLGGLASPPDGFGRMAQLAPGVTGVLAATASAWLSWRLARRFTSPLSGAAGTLGVWLGSHALYYSLVSPSYSHTASMLASTLFVTYWLSAGGRMSVTRAGILGGLAGLAALMRWQDALLLVVPLIEVIGWRVPWTKRVVAATSAVAASVVVFSPQMVVWNALYGQPLALPQGSSFMQWMSPHPFAVLFSDNHGLFTWAPILCLSVVGLVGFAGRHRDHAVALAIVLVGSWYVNAAVADWWAGEAFGARRFLSLFPLFVLGLSTWLHRVEATPRAFGRRLALAGGIAAANGLLLLQYQLFMKGLEVIAPYPHGWFDMWIARFLVPVRLLAWWAS